MNVLIRNMEMPTSCYDCRFHEVYSYKDGEKRVCELNWEVLFGDEWGKNFKHPDCPLIEVPEQKHGKWLYKGDRGGPNCLYICSVCNNEIRTYQPEAWNYCPNCGADMKGESLAEST